MLRSLFFDLTYTLTRFFRIGIEKIRCCGIIFDVQCFFSRREIHGTKKKFKPKKTLKAADLFIETSAFKAAVALIDCPRALHSETYFR